MASECCLNEQGTSFDGSTIASPASNQHGDRDPSVSSASPVGEESKLISWEVIRQHDRPDDCWVVYDGRVYDITAFIPNHPGGRTLWWQGGGRDITILFNISHPPRVKEESHIQKYGRYLGIADGAEIKEAPTYDWTSPFWCELKDKCWAKLNDLVRGYPGFKEGKFANVTYREFDTTTYHALLMILYLISFWFALWSPVFLPLVPGFFADPLDWARLVVAAVFCAPLAAAVSLTMHEARHRDMGATWYMPTDFASVSSARYMMEHVWHHNWPNLPDEELEMDLFAHAPGLRNFPWQKHRCYHRLQWLYWPVSFALVIPLFMLRDLKDWYVRGRVGKMLRGHTSWQEHCLFALGHLVVPLSAFVPVLGLEIRLGQFSIHHYWGQLIILSVILFGGSFWITLVNMPAHLPEHELDEAKMQYSDFGKTQIAHSKTYAADNTFLTWALQGMNTQIEHHLFPTVPFKYLQALTPIVAEVSARHGVEFPDPYGTFGEAFQQWLRRAWRLSSPAETCEGGQDTTYISHEVYSKSSDTVEV